MQPVAFVPPFWATSLRTLRRLTRMAATALVLVVGLNGVAAPVSADPVRPLSTVRPSAELPSTPASLDAPAGLSLPTDAATLNPTVAWATGQDVADSPNRQPRATTSAPATGVPARPLPSAATPVLVTGVAPVTGPGRESAPRRGPPRA